MPKVERMGITFSYYGGELDEVQQFFEGLQQCIETGGHAIYVPPDNGADDMWGYDPVTSEYEKLSHAYVIALPKLGGWNPRKKSRVFPAPAPIFTFEDCRTTPDFLNQLNTHLLNLRIIESRTFGSFLSTSFDKLDEFGSYVEKGQRRRSLTHMRVEPMYEAAIPIGLYIQALANYPFTDFAPRQSFGFDWYLPAIRQILHREQLVGEEISRLQMPLGL